MIPRPGRTGPAAWQGHPEPDHLIDLDETGAYMNFTPGVTPQEEPPATVKPWDWKGLLRRARLDFTTKAIGRAIADYADIKTGDDIFPGTAHLMVDTGASESTIRRALRKLRDLGLLRLVRPGNHRKGLADEYALAIPEDANERGLAVLTPDEYAAAVRAQAAAISGSRDRSPVTQTGDEAERRSHRPAIDSIAGLCDRPPTNYLHLPTNTNPPDELTTEPQLTTAREGEPMTPEEVDSLAEQTGLRGPALAREALARANKPFVRKGVVDVPAPPLPPVRPDNGLARLIAAAEEWGSPLVEPPCQDE